MRFACLVVLLAACGGSSSESTAAQEPSAETAPTSQADRDAAAQVEADRKLHQAQVHTIAAMCERLVDCSVEDAKATMTPKELADLKPDELVPRARAQCESDYGQSTLSGRQIKTIQGCVNDAKECVALNTCLEGAGKK